MAALVGAALTAPQVWGASQFCLERDRPATGLPTLADAQSHFYNARYEACATLTLALASSDADDLTRVELRTSALLFQLKGLLEAPPGRLEKDKPDKAGPKKTGKRR